MCGQRLCGGAAPLSTRTDDLGLTDYHCSQLKVRRYIVIHWPTMYPPCALIVMFIHLPHLLC